MKGRPIRYGDDAVVTFCGQKAKTRLQKGSHRRAIVDLLLENRGTMKVGAINQHFGFDCRDKVYALVRSNWIEVVE